MPPARNALARPGLDIELLGKMTEPLTVHVTRVRGGQRELALLPAREGYPPDDPTIGWTAAEVKAIDAEIVAAHGGGLYEVQVRDSSPDPLYHKYTTHIPTEMYPNMAPKFDGSLPGPGAAYGGWGPPGGGAWGGWGGWGARTPVGGAAPSGDEVARLREQVHQQQLAQQAERFEYMRRLDAPRDDGRLEREREERLRAERAADEARRAAERTADEARHRAEMDALKAMVAQLVTQAQAPKNTDEVAELKAELRRSEERRQQDMQIAETNRRMDALMAEIRAKPQGPDPMMMLIIETMKSSTEAARAAAQVQAEAAREAARLQTETAKEEARARAEEARATTEAQSRMLDIVTRAASAGNIPPIELMRMMQEAGRGAETAMRTVMGTTTELLDLHRNATANLLNMQPQGEGVAGRVVGAIENGIATFSEGQQKVAAAQAAAQAQVARAQADAMMAQAAIAQAQAGLGAPPASTPITPFTPNPYAPPPATPLPAGPTVDPMAQTTANIAPPTTAPVPTRYGKTDEEWFGMALPQVKLLREATAVYLAAIEEDEVDLGQKEREPVTIVDDKGPVGASPFLAADIVVKAVGQIAQLQQSGQLPAGAIPAFDVLFAQQAYPALVDCVLPEAPQQFRAEVVRYLWRHLNGQPLHDDNDPPLYGIEPFLKAAEASEPAPASTSPVALVPPNGAKPPRAGAPTSPRTPRGNARA